MTPTGREVGAKFAQKFGNRIAQCYLPYDTPRAVKKFLKATQPDLCLLMETEVWPNLTYFTKKFGIPTVLVNGRLSEKSFKQGQKAGSLIKDAFGRLTIALAQYEEDAERLKAAGAHDVKVLGNLKFDFIATQFPYDLPCFAAQVRHSSLKLVISNLRKEYTKKQALVKSLL